MNSNADSLASVPTSCDIVLLVSGIGPPVSFKNSKMLTKGKLITNPRKQRWMKQAQTCIESGLLCAYPTIESEMVTAAKLRSWIASSTPANDSCRYLIGCSWHFMRVAKGKEGALLWIKKIEP